MGNLSIRKLDDETLARLRQQAATQGVSMEKEARRILKQAVRTPATSGGSCVATVRPSTRGRYSVSHTGLKFTAGPRHAILLDTNVVSEVMKATPTHSLLDWVNQQETSGLLAATINDADFEHRGIDLQNSFGTGQ